MWSDLHPSHNLRRTQSDLTNNTQTIVLSFEHFIEDIEWSLKRLTIGKSKWMSVWLLHKIIGVSSGDKVGSVGCSGALAFK